MTRKEWFAFTLIAALALAACAYGAQHRATIRPVKDGTFTLIVEVNGQRRLDSVVTGISNISAALDQAKIKLAVLPGVPDSIRAVVVSVQTVDPVP